MRKQRINLYLEPDTVVKMDRLLEYRPEHCKSALVETLVKEVKEEK